MTEFRNSERTEQVHGATGTQLASGFFKRTDFFPTWIGSSSSDDAFSSDKYPDTTESAVDEAMLEVNSQLLRQKPLYERNLLRQELESLKQEMAVIKGLLKAVAGDDRAMFATKIDNVDEETFEEWLSRWQEDEPEAFLTEEGIEAEIKRYEEKYQMTSDEMLTRVREGTAPDNFEIMDWRILLRSI